MSAERNLKIHVNNEEQRNPKYPSPTPVDREIKLREDAILISVTDVKGVIEYCNEEFVDSSGYEEYELVGSAHNIIRHPDMPKVIFKMMWERIKKNQNMVAIVKNMAKTGRYYWVVTDFVVKKNEKGEVVNYKGLRRAAPRKAIEEIIPLYKKLKDIEDDKGVKGIESSEKFLNGFLDAKELDYDRFIEGLVEKSMELSEEDIKGKEANSKGKKGSFIKWFFFGDANL